MDFSKEIFVHEDNYDMCDEDGNFETDKDDIEEGTMATYVLKEVVKKEYKTVFTPINSKKK